MPRDASHSSDTNIKPDSEKAKLYKAVVAALREKPMTVPQLVEAIPFPRNRITQACQAARAVGDAHIGSYVMGAGGKRMRCYHAGEGVEPAPPGPSKNKASPVLPAKVLAALVRPMTVQDVMTKVFYTRPAIQHVLQLLCASGRVKITGRITQQGGTTLVYAPAATL